MTEAAVGDNAVAVQAEGGGREADDVVRVIPEVLVKDKGARGQLLRHRCGVDRLVRQRRDQPDDRLELTV